MAVIILVGAFMTQTLVDIIAERRLTDKIHTTLTNEVVSVSGARLSEMHFERLDGKLQVMAVIMTPREFEPAQVASIESVLRQQVDPNTSLIVRSLISKDADRGGTVYISEEDRLNQAKVSEKNQFLSKASALLTEQFRPIPGATMVDMFINDDAANSPLTINAVVRTPTPINPSQVADMEKTVSQLLDKDIHLVVRSVITRDADAQGYIYEEKEETEILTGEALEFHQKLDAALRKQILRRASSGSELVEFRYAERGENLMVLAVVHTPYTIRPTQVSQIESVLREQIDPRIQLVVRSVLGADTSSDEYLPSFDESVFNPDY